MMFCLLVDCRRHATWHQREGDRVKLSKSPPAATYVAYGLPVDHAAVLHQHVVILEDNSDRGDKWRYAVQRR